MFVHLLEMPCDKPQDPRTCFCLEASLISSSRVSLGLTAIELRRLFVSLAGLCHSHPANFKGPKRATLGVALLFEATIKWEGNLKVRAGTRHSLEKPNLWSPNLLPKGTNKDRLSTIKNETCPRTCPLEGLETAEMTLNDWPQVPMTEAVNFDHRRAKAFRDARGASREQGRACRSQCPKSWHTLTSTRHESEISGHGTVS